VDDGQANLCKYWNESIATVGYKSELKSDICTFSFEVITNKLQLIMEVLRSWQDEYTDQYLAEGFITCPFPVRNKVIVDRGQRHSTYHQKPSRQHPVL
jgi:hypothetical protein